MTRALIVDDEPENRYLLRALLAGHGFEVTEAGNGVEALAEARRQAPDIIVSDLLMPKMDGYSLLRAWKANALLANIPFIVYTATYIEPKDEKLACDLGADAFILKPAEPEPFMRRVQEVLARAQAGVLPPHAPALDEQAACKVYSEVLVKKLEKRSIQLEQRVGELAASEVHIQRLNHLYMALSETNQAIVHLTGREALFREVCRIAVERGGLSLAWIGLLDADGGEVVPVAWHGVVDEWFARLQPFSIRGSRRTPTECAIGDERIYLCNDLAADPALAPIYAELHKTGLHAAASLPLHLDGKVIGALTLFAGEKDFFDAQLTALVTEMAGDISFALENYEREAQRRQAEEALHRTNLELEQRVQARTAELVAANRELEAFAYSVAHDLRAPLRGISGFSRTLLDDHAGQLDETGREHLERVSRAAQHMGELIDDLLKLSMLGSHEIYPVEANLSRMAGEILAELVKAAPQRKVETLVAPDCTVTGDARLLRVLMQNLLENAMKYTGREAQARIEFACTPTAGGSVFHVRDNGAGFDMSHAERLFQPFRRLHRVEDFEGTGIGLATAARILARHGGRIWAEAEKGKGATFFFTLPVGPGAAS